MKHKFLTLLLLCFGMAVDCLAQSTIAGVVCDSVSGETLMGVSVLLRRDGKTLKFGRTDGEGAFTISADKIEDTDLLQATYMGYRKKALTVKAFREGKNTLLISEEAFSLKEVKVQGSRVFGRDTVTYDLTRFATERDNNLEDVLKKLPGVDVSKEGTVSYNGKDVSRFTVEGLDLTGGRYTQLTQNIRAKDVKKAEIVEHDQPIKALQDKTWTDNVGINIGLKDEARDRFTLTLRPHVLVGDGVRVGGSANSMQLGKKKQRSYDAAYDRSGKNLGKSSTIFANMFGAPSGASLPSWLSVPSLQSPLDAERMRFNTSQHYAVSELRKRGDSQWRVSAGYDRSVVRQTTSNVSEYFLGGDDATVTTEDRHMTLRSDDISAEVERTHNASETFGTDRLRLTASQRDGLLGLSQALTSQVRTPKVDASLATYRLWPLKKGSLTLRAVGDFHHGVSDLFVNADRTRMRSNLWHEQASLTYQQVRGSWTRNYGAEVEAENINVRQAASSNHTQIGGKLSPSWQYKKGEVRLSLGMPVSLDRFISPNKTWLHANPHASLNLQPTARTEWNLTAAYNEQSSSMQSYVLSSYQRDYRTLYDNDGIVPITRSLYSNLRWSYKRPIYEFFANANATFSRSWMNSTTDLTITDDGLYHNRLVDGNSHASSFTVRGMLSKGFYKLHLKTSLDAIADFTRGQQLSAGNTIDYRNRSILLTPAISFSPDWGALSYEANLGFNHTNTVGLNESDLFNLRQELSLTATIGKVDLNYSLVHYRNELQEGNTKNTVLSDASLTWRIKKVRLQAALTNLFNKKQYTETTYSGVLTSTSIYWLRPRELKVSAQVSL